MVYVLPDEISDGQQFELQETLTLHPDGDFASGAFGSGWTDNTSGGPAGLATISGGILTMTGDTGTADGTIVHSQTAFTLADKDFIEIGSVTLSSVAAGTQYQIHFNQGAGSTAEQLQILFISGQIFINQGSNIATGKFLVASTAYTFRIYHKPGSNYYGHIFVKGGAFTTFTFIGVTGASHGALLNETIAAMLFRVTQTAATSGKTMIIDNVNFGVNTLLAIGGVGSAGNWEAIFNTIRKRFKEKDVDLISPALPTEFDNAPFSRPDNLQWARLSIQAGERIQQDFGSSTKRFRNTGTMTVQIFVPLEKGDKAALEAADFIDSVFRSVTDTGVVFRSPSITPVGRFEKEWQVNVTCPFYADIIA